MANGLLRTGAKSDSPMKHLSDCLRHLEKCLSGEEKDKLKEVIMKESVAISQDLAQKLTESMPSRIAEVLKKKGQHCKY